MNLDITFCSNLKCKNMNCDRNQNKLAQELLKYKDMKIKPYLSIAEFKNCEFWEVEENK